MVLYRTEVHRFLLLKVQMDLISLLNTTHQVRNRNQNSAPNSAPSSPNLNKSNQKSNTKISATSKIRSSISTSSNMKNINDGTETKKIIKKIAFSDDEIINDKPTKKSSKSRKSNDSEKESEPLNDSLNDSNETNDQRRWTILFSSPRKFLIFK